MMPESPSQRLYRLILGYRVTQAIRAAAILGVCDALGGEPLPGDEVSRRVGGDPRSMRTLLGVLVSAGLLRQSEDGRFQNTELGALLRAGVAGSLRSSVIGMCAPSWWRAWSELPQAVRSGNVAFGLANGDGVWDELRADPEAAARFNAFMAGGTDNFLPQLLGAVDLVDARHIVDVGGGTGALLAGILDAYPDARGTLFDLPAGMSGADDFLRARSLDTRCTLVHGNFFESIPSGGDVYVLRFILHDWPDERAAAILASCRRAMSPGTRLLVIDALLPPRATDDEPSLIKHLYDLHMFVLFGAHERTEAEMRALLDAAAFSVRTIHATEPVAIVDAVAV